MAKINWVIVLHIARIILDMIDQSPARSSSAVEADVEALRAFVKEAK